MKFAWKSRNSYDSSNLVITPKSKRNPLSRPCKHTNDGILGEDCEEERKEREEEKEEKEVEEEVEKEEEEKEEEEEEVEGKW